MVLRRFLIFAALLLAGGCVSQNRSTGSGANADGAFRAPADIRPADSSVQPAPAPIAVPQIAIAAPRPLPHIAGEWAPPVQSRPWRYIVIHHSASPTGNAALFDREHREKGWDELGYHFVIDNGRGGGDGAIEMGPRWAKQKWGAHAKTPDNRYNDFGIGICFVGNFEQSKPTARQLQSAQRLVAWLMETYNIPARNVIGHEDTGKQTLCPGKNLSVAQVRSLAVHALADAGIDEPTGVDLADVVLPPLNAHVAMMPASHELLKTR